MTKKSFNIFHISNDDSSGNNVHRTSDVEKIDKTRVEPRNNWRDLIAYWIFGLCNNFGYVVMLTAAKDILQELGSSSEVHHGSSNRPCNLVSTGAVLLADVIPGLCIKFLSPFLPFWHATRISISCLIAIGGFIVVGFATEQWIALTGVAMTSFASGLGEPTFLAYSAFFNKNVISTWSSGTGGAGIFGALAYSVLREIGLNNQQTMLVMVSVPAAEFLTFFFLLSKPASKRIEDQHKGDKVVDDIPPMTSFKEKIIYIKQLLHFMIPLCLVYLFEYYINQGLFEMAYFPENILDLDSKQQYRWYQVTYQIGVFISRSSVNVVHIKQIWIMAVLQGLNVIFFMFEAIYMFTPSIWIIFGLILFEGLLGGGAYVNTFYRMSREIPATRREYAMSVVTLSDSLGITLAGFLAMPTHNWICSTPGPRIP
ncbi:hypothetical protein PVAND_012697 [Polypedilum vanderplanki]|uniref:Battenin n=1 Tax=Polypedilum vanderplanki TaxID=319348 RepID=A0A9J6CP83_POLVA|nr:hypothetical protein PVAND_012697 [Polypedilum vanderplanki]